MDTHQYTVALSISGAGLALDAVTRELGLQPFRADHRAEPVWRYDGGPGSTGRKWSTLEEGLQSLLDDLEPLRDRLLAYAERFEVVLWCGSFQSTFGGGPALSGPLLRRLADLGLPLVLDNYFDGWESDPTGV